MLPKFTLREKDILKASQLIGVDAMTIRKLNDQNLLDTDAIRRMVIRYDYDRLVSGLKFIRDESGGRYTYNEILQALQKEYNISKPLVRRIVRSRKGGRGFCRICGKEVEPKTLKRTGGMCSECFSQTIIENNELLEI